jgi:hypothetical protein
MFIREKKNKSGSSSIQIISKSAGKYKVVKTIVSSSSQDGILLFPFPHRLLQGTVRIIFNYLTDSTAAMSFVCLTHLCYLFQLP